MRRDIITGMLSSYSYYLSRLSAHFIILIASLFFIGGVVASWTGIIKLFGPEGLFRLAFFPYHYISAGNAILGLINLAEYLLVGITFFAITSRLLLVSYIDPKRDEESEISQAQRLANTVDLDKYIIGMVVATISVAFIGLVVGVSGLEAANISLKTGIGIAAVITSLGLYHMFSS